MRTLIFATTLLALAACKEETPLPGGESDAPYCADVATDITLDEVTPLGMSAADVLAGIPASEQASFEYANGDTPSALDVAFTAGTGLRFVESEAVYPEGENGEVLDLAIVCEDRIEIDGVLELATGDGVFAESLDVILTASAEGVGIFESLDAEDMGGTFDITEYVGDHTDAGLWLEVAWVDGVSQGTIEGQVTTEEECEAGDECSVSAEMFEVGGWTGGLIE